ncbi:MAG: hypothetical protein KDJ68_03745 [Rhodobiaceae bacterium]|nr:hypothetical protein [Rhodobiaceae bacterium]MCC0060402.1 hypothetical protein [Rhodobiaceae bacterium]
MPALLTRLAPILMIMALAFAAPARAEMCRIADPTGTPLNVRATPGGDVVNRLKNGRKVFKDAIDGWDDEGNPKWAHVVGEYKGQWRDWGWVFINYLDCGHDAQNRFPIIFENPRDMVPTGIVVPWGYEGQAPPKLDHECFFYGDGGYSMSLSDELVQAYRARGYNQEQLCVVLRSPGLKYDPQTGKRLPTFIVVDPQALAQARQSGFFEGFEATEELPLHAPDCFAKSRVSKQSGIVSLNIACDIRFDPWTGVELSPMEQAYYKQNVALAIEGAAGPSGNIAGKELIVSGQNRATNASIRTVMDIRKGNR